MLNPDLGLKFTIQAMLAADRNMTDGRIVAGVMTAGKGHINPKVVNETIAKVREELADRTCSYLAIPRSYIVSEKPATENTLRVGQDFLLRVPNDVFLEENSPLIYMRALAPIPAVDNEAWVKLRDVYLDILGVSDDNGIKEHLVGVDELYEFLGMEFANLLVSGGAAFAIPPVSVATLDIDRNGMSSVPFGTTTYGPSDIRAFIMPSQRVRIICDYVAEVLRTNPSRDPEKLTLDLMETHKVPQYQEELAFACISLKIDNPDWEPTYK